MKTKLRGFIIFSKFYKRTRLLKQKIFSVFTNTFDILLPTPSSSIFELAMVAVPLENTLTITPNYYRRKVVYLLQWTILTKDIQIDPQKSCLAPVWLYKRKALGSYSTSKRMTFCQPVSFTASLISLKAF